MNYFSLGFRTMLVKDLVRISYTGGIPRSLHIFLARVSLISECLGIAERLFSSGFLSFPRIHIHKEALEREAFRESLYYERMGGSMFSSRNVGRAYA